MARKKSEPAEGVAVTVREVPDRHEDGIAVAVPRDDSAQEPKTTAKSAASTKEK